MKVHVLDDWDDTLRHLPAFAALAGLDVTVHTAPSDPSEYADAEALCLFRERTSVDAALLGRLPALRLISLRGSTDHVDLATCAARGVAVCAAGGGSTPPHATAELTLALILSDLRRLPAQFDGLRAGRWQAGVGLTAHGRTLGVYGPGRIGRAVGAYAAALGMRVIWWGSEAGRHRIATEGGVVPESRRAFFETADIVTLHLRLAPGTRGIVTAEDLAAMKDGATLVNTARAALVAPGALEAELGRLRAALDVFPEEPLRAGHPLATHPAVTATPHIGHVTEEELDAQFADVFAQVAAFAQGAPINLLAP